MQEGGMKIFPASEDSPLSNLQDVPVIYGYATAMWTDEPLNIQIIHDHLREKLEDVYLGCMVREQKIGGQMEFFDFERTLQLPVAVSFRDGEVLEKTNKIGI